MGVVIYTRLTYHCFMCCLLLARLVFLGKVFVLSSMFIHWQMYSNSTNWYARKQLWSSSIQGKVFFCKKFEFKTLVRKCCWVFVYLWQLTIRINHGVNLWILHDLAERRDGWKISSVSGKGQQFGRGRAEPLRKGSWNWGGGGQWLLFPPPPYVWPVPCRF